MSAKGSELKRVRQSNKARIKNKSYNSKINTVMKRVQNASNKKEATELLNDAIKVIDKIASKKIIHKNKAANKKSNLYKIVNNLK